MRSLILLAVLASPAFAQSGPRERGDLILRARSILKTHCAACHGPGGPSFDILDHATLTGPHPVPFAKPGGRSQIIEFLEDGSMPPAGKPRPSPEEIGVLKAWIAAGAPAYPRAFDDVYVAAAVEGDAKSRKPVENFRYITFANRIDGESGVVSLRDAESKLRASLQSATSAKRSVSLEHVDPTGVVYRLDVEKLGWTEPDRFEEINLNGAAGNAADFLTVDLIQLEYPFGPIAKPLPKGRLNVFRGDWLIEALAHGSPLAADLRSMAELSDAKSGDESHGPKLTFAKLDTPSAKGVPPPVTAWYGSDRTTNLLSVQFEVKGRKPPYAVKESEPVFLEATSNRGGRGVVFSLLPDGTVRQHTPIEAVLKQGEPSNFRGALKLTLPGSADEARERFILFATDEVLPKFTIIRSQHAEDFEKKEHAPVWRIIADPTVKFDPARVVRHTIELRVTKK